MFHYNFTKTSSKQDWPGGHNLLIFSPHENHFLSLHSPGNCFYFEFVSSIDNSFCLTFSSIPLVRIIPFLIIMDQYNPGHSTSDTCKLLFHSRSNSTTFQSLLILSVILLLKIASKLFSLYVTSHAFNILHLDILFF